MAKAIPLPDGTTVAIREGETPAQTWERAQRMYPEAFGLEEEAKPKQDTKGFKAAMSAGATRLGGEFELLKGKLGVKSEAEAQKEYEAAQKRAQERFTPTEEGWTEAPFQKFKETLGGSLPYMAAPAAAGLAALAAPVTAPVAAGLGLLGAGAVSTGQFTGSNLARQMDTGKSLEEASLGKAAAAAVPQALIDTAAMALLPGVGKLFGSVGSKLTTEQAKAIASQTLGKAAMDYTAKTGMAMGREGITEVAQQTLERLQAGLNIADPEARKEYIDSFIGGAVLGGTLAPAGRYIERSGAQTQAAKAEREERSVLAQQAAEQQRVAEQAAEAQRQTPDHALRVGQEYDTLLAEFQARKAALKTPGKDATPVEKAEYADAQKAIKEINAQLKDIVPEYRRTAPIRARAAQEQAAAAEEARVAGLSPEEYAAEQASAQQGVGVPKKVAPVEGDPFAMAQRVDPVQEYVAQQKALADQQMITPPTVADYASYLMVDPLKAMDVVQTRTPMPGLTKRQNETLLGGLALQIKEYEKTRAAQGRLGTAASQQRVAGVEAEEQAALEEQRAQTERDIQEAQREQALGGEFAGLQRMGAPQAGSRGVFDETTPYSLGANLSDQFSLFGTEQSAPAGSAAMGQMQQKLTGDDVTFTAEEEKARNLRRVPGAEFKLRGRNEGTAPVTREELADRLNRVLAAYDLSPEAADLLLRAEKALPQSGADYFVLLDEQLAKIESGAEGVPRKGQSRTLDLQTFPPSAEQQAQASTTAPTEAGTSQVRQITGAQPGQAASGLKTPIAQPDVEDRRTGVRGAADVTKRVADTQPSTLRGPSARAGELSLARELSEPLRMQEEAARVDTGQKSLFPEEQEKLGAIKGNRGAFQMFMKSKFVQNLRQQLRRDEEIAKRAQAIPALEKRANALVAEIEDILKQYAEYRNADAIIKANKDVAKAKRDMADIRAAAGKSTVDRMVLAGAIEDLKQARKQVIEQGYNEGGVQELVANIDAVNAQLQDAQTDMALLNSALSVLDGQLQSFAAVQKLTALIDKAPSVERIDQAKQELRAVQTELGVLQEENKELQNRMRKDAADKKRADEAVRQAERNAQVAAGRIKPAEQALNNLPLYDKATQYPALTEAQLLAREKGGTLPDLTAGEKIAIGGDPARVLGGYRARITALEKTIKQSQDKSKAALGRDMVEPKQNLRDALAKAYKQAKSATERDALGPKLDVAEAELARAKAELSNTDVIWVGMKSQIKQLADVIAREEWLSGMISEGRIELEAPSAAKVRAKPTAEEREQASARRVEDASVRTTGASTSGEPLTRSQAAKARQPQKTLFEGKGEPGGAAVEIGGPTTLEKMQARARERLAQDLLRSSEALRLKYIPVYYKGALPTDDTAEAAAAVAVQRQVGRDRRAIPFSEKIRDALAKAIAETKSDLEVFSGNPKYREYVAEDTQLLAELRKMRVEDFSDTEPKVAPRVPVKTLLAKKAAIAPTQKPVRNTAEDYTSDQVAKNLGTTFVKDAPFHGMTFAEAARYGAKRTTSPQVRALFEKLADVFAAAPVQEGAGRVYAIDRLLKGNAAGIYSSRHDVIYTRAPVTAGMSANKVLLHELTHAATVRGMQLRTDLADQMESLRQQTASWLATPEGRAYFRNHKMGLAQTPAGIYGLTNHKEFVAELFANREFQKLLAEIPSSKPRKSIFTRFVETLAQFFNMPGKAAQSLFAEAVALTEEVLDVTKNEIYSGKAPAGGFLADVSPMRAEPETSANAIEALSRDIVAQPKTLKQKLGDSVALQAEMQGVDMRAGLREVFKAGAAEMGDDTKFTQAMYNVLKADQKMPVAYTVMSMGPLELYKDAKGFYGVRSTNKHSAKDVFDAIADMPGTDTQSKIDVATTYMIAQRAANKGLSKLDLGELGVTQEKLDAAMAAVEADPALEKSLEAVRRAYNAYNKGQISFLAASGAIPKQVAEKLLAGGDYVPYYRVKDNGMAELNFGNNVMVSIGDIRRQPYLASLKGGETKILPLNESLPLNTFLLTDMALTNMATKNVAYALQAMGKKSDVMQIHSGTGPADPGVIRFKQEPDPNNEKDTGERWLKVETKGTAAEGVPAELLVQSLEGSHLALPEFLKLGGVAADLLRSGVTRTPLYIARQLIRDPMAAAFTGGLNYNAFTAVLKAGKEFVRMNRGTSDAQMKLLEKGLVQSGIFAGDTSDMKKMALQIASGKDQSVMDKVFAAADRAALRADAATRSLVYENAEANGLSDVEADMMTMESMNFYKRGLSPTLQYASRLIPFFNAQIQGLNVLFKAARGNMPFEEQQQIKRKFFNNAMLLVATGLVYAMAMEDDESFRNARPRDKYTNFFLPIPGLDEPIKLPIPFEAGYFYSLAVAAVDGMRAETDSKEQWKALKDMFLNSIPGYSSMGIPQIVKPAFEVWTNKNFMSGSDIESRRFQGMDTEERYNANTTELAKAMSKALPILSPIQIEHMVRGYLGVLPLAVAGAANGLFAREGKGEAPEKRLSELPVLGPAFQKKYGGGDKDVAYEMAEKAMTAKTTLNKLVAEGRREDAVAYRDENRARLAVASAAGQYRQLVGRINADLRRTQERSDLTAAEKRVRIDNLEKAADEAAKRFTQRVRQVQDQ
jgi:hypothetical protein